MSQRMPPMLSKRPPERRPSAGVSREAARLSVVSSDTQSVSQPPSVSWQEPLPHVPGGLGRMPLDGGLGRGGGGARSPSLGHGRGLSRSSTWASPHLLPSGPLPLPRNTPHLLPIPYCEQDRISERQRIAGTLSVQDIKGLFVRVKDKFPHTEGLSRPNSKTEEERAPEASERTSLSPYVFAHQLSAAGETPPRSASTASKPCPMSCGRLVAPRSKHCCRACARSGGHQHGSSCSKREARAAQPQQASSQPSLPSVSRTSAATDGPGRGRGGALDRTLARSLPSSSPALLGPPPLEMGAAAAPASAPGSGAGDEPGYASDSSPSPPPPPRSADRLHLLTPPAPETPPSTHSEHPVITRAALRRRKEGLAERQRGEHRTGDVLDGLRNRALLQRHQWLVHCPEFMQQQIGQLKRGKTALRQALSNYEEEELYENACLYTPYAMTLRKRKDRIQGHASGNGGNGLGALRGGLPPTAEEHPPPQRKKGGSPKNRINSVTLQVRALKQNLKVSQRALETVSFQVAAAEA